VETYLIMYANAESLRNLLRRRSSSKLRMVFATYMGKILRIVILSSIIFCWMVQEMLRLETLEFLNKSSNQTKSCLSSVVPLPISHLKSYVIRVTH